MQMVNVKQITGIILLGVIFIWLLRLGNSGETISRSGRQLEPLVLAEFKPKSNWEAKEFRERLLVFVPEKKGPSAAEKAAAAKAAELARQKKAAASAPPPVDKTLKPMFSQLDDNHQVGLVAVIDNDDSRYAVLQKTNFATKQNQNFKLQNAASFEGWTLNIESQTRVVLNKSGKKIYLNLFKRGNI